MISVRSPRHKLVLDNLDERGRRRFSELRIDRSQHGIQPALIGGAARLPFLPVLIGIIGGMESFGLLAFSSAP
jgi:hypothetical protein